LLNFFSVNSQENSARDRKMTQKSGIGQFGDEMRNVFLWNVTKVQKFALSSWSA